MPSDLPDITAPTLTQEPELTFDDLNRVADEPTVAAGPWPRGWYPATIVEGYATPNGTQWRTEDTPSKSGDSRNLRVCFQVTNSTPRKAESVTVKRKGESFGPFDCPALSGGETRTTWASLNYRLSDLTKERVDLVERLRKIAVEEKWGNKWPQQYADAQRSSLALGQLGQLYKALGFGPKKIDAGFISVAALIGQKLDLRLGVNSDGYNDGDQFAKLGEGGKKK